MQNSILENVPMVTDWITAISSAISAFAVSIGLFFANLQLNNWKTTLRKTRRLEVAEGIWSTAHKIVDVFRGLRHQLNYVPQSEIKNKNYIYDKKLEFLRDKNDLFENMRDLQIRAKVLIPDIKIDFVLDEIFRARADYIYSIQDIGEANLQGQSLDAEDRKAMVLARQIAFGRFDEKDKFGTALNNQLLILETLLGPEMRLSK